MRICIVTGEYAGITASTGGIGMNWAALAPELVRQGHETHAVVLADARRGDLEHEGVQIHLRPTPATGRLWYLQCALRPLVVDRALLALGPFDVVYAAEWQGEAWRYARRRRRSPLVTLLATSLAQISAIAPRDPTRAVRIQGFIQDRLERGQAERSDGIVASSTAILDWAAAIWSLDGIPNYVVPNFINLGRVRRLAEGELPKGFPLNVPSVLFFGKLEVRKGVHVLLQAMSQVWARLPETHVVLIGRDADYEGGSMADHLRELAGEYGDRLHILDEQPAERLMPAVAAADVVASPSLWENFSLAALEARALGRPMVVTTDNGFGDFFEHERECLMVPPGEAEPLSGALLRLLQDRALRERLGSRAASDSDNYTPPAVTRRLVEHFEAVVDIAGQAGLRSTATRRPGASEAASDEQRPASHAC